MFNSLASLFNAPRTRETGKNRVSRLKKAVRRRPDEQLGVQSLEQRLALTAYTSLTPLTAGGFAYNIVIDDNVDASGYGRDAYLQRGSDGTQYFLLDDNPGFSSPTRLGVQNQTYGTCNTIFVTSGSRQSGTTATDPAVNSSTYSYALPSASPLGVSGSVTINTPGGSLSFDYQATSLPFTGGNSTNGLTPWTITPTNATAWSTAGYGTPTGRVTLSGGTSTLSFDFIDATTKAPKAINSASITNFSYLYFQSQPNPQSFTAFAGQTFDQRLIVDLQPVGSSVSINSPWLASLGSQSDQFFYSQYDGGDNAGQMSLYATNLNINQTATTTSRFAAGSTSRRASGFNTSTLSTTVAAPVNAQNYAIEVTGSYDNVAKTTTHGSLLVSQTGSLVGSGGGAAGSMTVTSDWADIRFLGQVNVSSQNYLLRANGSPDQFDLSTRSSTTGLATGTVSGSTLAMTLGQPGGGNIDLRTNITNLRFDAGVNASSIPYRYTVAIDEQSALQVDAVAASSGPISLKAAGDMTVVGSAIRTSNDIALLSSGTLTINGDISTADGSVSLNAPTLTLGSVVTAGGSRGVTLVSGTGATTANALTRAGGTVKQTVRVASIQNVVLAGTTTIDGVTLVDGDRVLLKNQTAASENGIYVYSSAGGGTLARATDADTAGELLPGFVVFVDSATVPQSSQSGGWTLLNPSTPILGQTGLQFAPVSATRTYDEVKAATTGSITLSGPQTIDGVAVVAGDRVLVKNQSNAAQNGIYVVQTGAWQRASDADTTAELTAGSFVFVQVGGATNGGKGYALQSDAIQVGTTPLTFVDFFATTSGSTSWAPARVLPDVAVATTVNIVLTGLQTIDGVALAGGERVLVKNQINASENGVYVAAAGAWSRATDADVTGELPRSTTVYIIGGTQGQNTSWQFNDSIQMLATTTANSATISGLVTTTGLAVGMLVTGLGIPGGTTIASLGTNGTSVRLSQNATLSGTGVALSFVKTTAVVVGTDPVVFIPVGGGVTVTAATNIGGSSLLQGSTALLTAGTAGAAASNISAQTNFGRISASAPGPIVVTNANSLELQNVRTTTAGGITATANGTITALTVSATGTAGTPGNVSLTSIYGDVVAESITSNIGDIALTSINGSVAVTKARLNAANISASAGSITATADATGAVITIDGRLNAQLNGAAGGDISLLSNAGQLAFTGSANVVAADQLVISTPASVPTIANGAQISAARLSLTSQFGAGIDTPPAGLGTYQVVAINRTDAGDIVFASAADLTVESASTADGSISFSAPNLTITGPILPQGPGNDRDITLSATAGNLYVDSAITSQRDVTLSATAGQVRSSSGAATALVTAPRDLTVNASDVANVLAKAAGFNATLTAAGAALTVTDTDGLDIKSVTLANGGTALFSIGSASSGGDATIGLIDVGPTGTVTINAYGSIVEDTVDAGVADIIAGTANLNATTGQIKIDTDVNVLSAGVQQKNQNIVINDVGATGLELKAVVGSNNANVNVTAKGTIVATNVTTTGTISLTTTNPTADILVNQLTATANTVTLSAGRSILEVTPGDATPDISASAVTLTAGTGSIDVHLATSTVAATATTAGSTISLKDDDDLSLAGINGKTVTVTVGGLASQTLPVVADALTVTSTGGKDITLLDAANKIGTFSATSVNGATKGTISVLDSDADLVLGTITGGPVVITSTGAGPITQVASTAITATKLTVNNTAGAVVLANPLNDATSVAIANAGRPVNYTDANGFDIAGISGGAVILSAAGDITQSAAITATSLNISNAAGIVSLGNALNDASSVAIINVGRAITYTDANGFDIAGISGGAVTLTAAGNVTQSANITATSLVVTNTAGTVWLGNPSNNAASVAIANAGRAVTYTNAAGFDIAGISGSAVALTAGGTLTQSAAIAATTLNVSNSAGSVLLGNAANDAASVAIINVGRAITYTDANGFDITGISGGAVALTAAGNVTQSANITATSLAVTNTAGTVILGNASNNAASVAIANAGRIVTYVSAVGFDVAGIAGSAVALTAGGTVTQSAAITATTLDITGTAGAILLNNAANSVVTLNSASTPGGDVTFVNAGTFATGPVTAGTAATGDGNILLKSVNGDINVNGNLTAINDRVTLEARNGTFTLANGVVIDAYILVYYVATPPDFGVGTTIPTIVAANGDLTISQSGPITFGGYTTDGNITITGTNVTINGLLQTTGLGKSVTVTATAGNIAFVGAGAIDNAVNLGGATTLSAAAGTITGSTSSAVSGATTTLLVGQALSFSGPLSATSLIVTGAGAAVSLAGINSVGSVAIANGSGSVVFNDSTGNLTLAGITGGTVTVNAAGAVDQTGAVNAGAFTVNGSGSAITLNTQANTVTSFAASNGSGSVLFNDTTGGLTLAGVTGGTVTIGANGAVDQSGAVVADAFTINGIGSTIALNTQANAVSSLAASNGSGSVLFNDTAGGLTLAGITGGTVTIGATGAVDQSGAVNADAFTISGNGSAIALNTQANTVNSFAASNGAGSVLFNDTTGGLALAGITGGTVTIGANGAVSQTGAVNADTFTVNGNGSAVTLAGANVVNTFAANNGAGSVSFTDTVGSLSLGNIVSGQLTIAAAGPVSINQTVVNATGNVTITTQAGGGLTVAGPGGLLQSTATVNLSGVQGAIVLVSGGMIVGNPIIGNGQNVVLGGNITTVGQLNTAIAAVNTMPAIIGSSYELVVASSMTLTQTLVVNRPVVLRGTSSAIVLSGSPAVVNGLVLNSGAAGSRVTSLAFSGFSGTGLQLNSVASAAISGVTVTGTRTGTGTGLVISGSSAGTVVQGNVFTNNPYGIKLISATGVTVGGTLAGQRNTISGAARAGVFAGGFCTGSSVIRTVFPASPATPVQYNIASSRNLRVVR